MTQCTCRDAFFFQMSQKLERLLEDINYANPYSILEIDEGGNFKKAYRELALKYHPDKNTTNTTKEQTAAKQMNRA